MSAVVLVPTPGPIPPDCEADLAELAQAGVPVRRSSTGHDIDTMRSMLASDALADGFEQLFWADPDVEFTPSDLLSLAAHDHTFVCSLTPHAGRTGFDCVFRPGTGTVRAGSGANISPVLYPGFSLTYTHRSVFDAVLAHSRLPAIPRENRPPWVPYFAPFGAVPGGDQGPPHLLGAHAFGERARRAGVTAWLAPTARVWRIGRYRYGWEDGLSERERLPTVVIQTDGGTTHRSSQPPPTPLSREPLRPLSADFPQFRAYVATYPANRDSLDMTLADFRQSDWGSDPNVFVQPADWPTGRDSGSNNYRRILEHAANDECDYALVLEDDVRVCRHLRHNLSTLPLVRRGQCDYLSLFMPDLVADPWQRQEPHLGYRLARPRYGGPNKMWQKYRVWGSQAYVLSRLLILAALERWDRLKEGQDTRMLGVCSELKAPLWYTAPCWAEHAPLRTAFQTPPAYAPDFDPDFRLTIRPGFQPPEAVPGWFTINEGRLLWEMAAGRSVLELGTASGRSTVCMGQSAARVVSVDIADQSEAAEWVRRFDVADRVTFRRGDVAAVCGPMTDRFGLVFVDTGHDAASVARDIDVARARVVPGGLVAFHDYPEPGWPDVRREVDRAAAAFGWKRIAQADYLGVFRTPTG